MKTMTIALGTLLCLAGVARGADFTWTGGGADSNWTTPANWGQESTYPKSSVDTATIPANASAAVTLTSNLTLGKITFGAGCSFALTGVATANGNPVLTLYGLDDNGIARLALDAVSVSRSADWTPKAGCSFVLTHGANLTLNSFYLTEMDSISLSGGSTMSVHNFYFNGASRTITLDDSSFFARLNAFLGTANPGGGRFVFKGRHPLFRAGNVFRSNNNSTGMTEYFHFDFEVPEGGFAETTIQSYNEMLMYSQGSVVDGYMQFTVLATSPAVTAGESLDFCAYVNPRGASRAKVSNGNEATSALRFANGSPEVEATSDAEANMIWLKVGSGDPTEEASHASALLDYKTTAVSRNTITATTWITALATDGSVPTCELWVGEANNTATMALASSAILGHVGSASLSFTAPENIGEKRYYFQFRILDVDGAKTNATTSTTVFNAITEDASVYTWKAKNGDWSGDWHDVGHWSVDVPTKTGIPEMSHSTAVFPRGHAITVTIDDNTTVGTIDLTDDNPNDTTDAIQLTLRGKDGDAYGTNKTLTVTTLSLAAPDGYLKLDRAKMSVSSDITLGERRRFELANGSCLSIGKFNSKARGTFYIGGDSSVNAGGLMIQENEGTALVIDDSTIYFSGDNYQVAVQNVSLNAGTILFRGTHPVMRFKDGKGFRCINNTGGIQDLTFEVPLGGYAAAPIQTEKSSTVDFPISYGFNNYLRFVIDPASPCYTRTETFDTPLVAWPGSKSVLTSGKQMNTFDTLGDGGYFCYGTSGTSPYGWVNVSGFSGTAKSIGAHVVSVAHNDLMSVSDDVGNAVAGTVPAYDASSQSAVASEGSISFSAPATYESAGVRYTCAGATLTEIAKTASGSVTSVTEKAGNSFSYAVANKEISVVWHFTKDYKVDVAAVNDANATVAVTAGSEYVTETVSATLTASTASENMEFQYWYGDLPYTNRYANPIVVTAGKAPTVRAFFGRKASSAGTISAEGGNNVTKDWFDAATWTDGVIPGTNDAAIVRWTEASSYNNARFAVTADSFFAVKSLVISNAQVMVNSSRRDNTAGGIALETSLHVDAPDQTRTEPVGCDIWGDLVIDCYQTDSSKYSGSKRSINGGRLYVGGDYQQGGSQIEVRGDLTVADGELVVQAGYPFNMNWIDKNRAVDGPTGSLPFTDTNEFFRGRNFVRVRGTTTVKTPARTDTADTTAYNVIRPVNEFRTGAAVWFDLKDLEIQPRGAFSASWGSYGKFDGNGRAGDTLAYSMCPGGHGATGDTSGGSYGGFGGSEKITYPVQTPTTHVLTYGFANAPYYPGSSNGGGRGLGYLGGGSIRIDCESFVLDGSLLANGASASGGMGGASGGGIWVIAKSFAAGSGCSVQAKGGASTGTNAGGGGGRVAICENLTDEQVESLYSSADHTAEEATVTSLADKLGSRFSAAGGTGTTQRSDGYDGTGVYIVNTGGKRTMTVAGSPSNIGSPEPAYGPHVFEENEVISLIGPSDAYVSEDNRSKRLCTGYTITDAEGDVLADSDERTGSYTITEDCTLTWKITTLVHALEVGATEGGTIVTNAIGDASSVWQTDGSTVSLTAVPASGYAFAGWYGELPTNLQQAATLAFTHTKGRSFRALFVTAAAGEANWTGEGDGTSWEDPENWSINAIPGPNSAVEIPAGANVVADFCVPIAVKRLAIAKNAALAIGPNGSYSTYSTPRILENAKETDWQRIALSVADDLAVDGTFSIGGRNSLAQFDLTVGGSLVFGDGAKGSFYAAYSAPSKFLENPATSYGTNQAETVEAAACATSGRITVGNALEVATNAVVSVWCDYYSGASVRFGVDSLFIAEGGRLEADEKGWGYVSYSGLTYSLAPPLENGTYNIGRWSGGTHAGVGGYGASHHIPADDVYGWKYAPFLPGISGFNTVSAQGGGVIRIHAKRMIRCYGTISAGGNSSGSCSGGGAGGSIFLSGSRIRTSDSTVIRADGHDSSGSCGAGSGGRLVIARHLNDADLAELESTGSCAKLAQDKMSVTDLMSAETQKPFKGLFTAKGGVSSSSDTSVRHSGEGGTAVYIEAPGPGFILLVR